MPRLRTLVLVTLALAGGAWLLSQRPRAVLQEETEAGSIRVVERRDGVRELYLGTGRGRQTALHPDRPDRLELPYTRVAMAALATVREDPRILFVGLGGGAMPRYVRLLLPEARIQVVELEPRVVEVAREWFGFRTDSLLSVHVGDGRAFIEAAAPGSWDLVVLDAFSGAAIPERLTTREFLEAVEASLAIGGVVVSNLHTTFAEYGSMLATYQSIFPGVILLDVPRRRQRILLAGPAALLDRESLLSGIRALEARRDPGFDLSGTVEWGFELPEPATDEVLRDPRPSGGA